MMKEGEGREEQKLSLDGLPKLTFEQKWKWCAVPCTASLAGMRSESRMRLRAAIELCPGGRRASSPPAHPQTNTDRLRYSSPLFAAEDLTRLVETRFVLIIIPACCYLLPTPALQGPDHRDELPQRLRAEGTSADPDLRRQRVF